MGLPAEVEMEADEWPTVATVRILAGYGEGGALLGTLRDRETPPSHMVHRTMNTAFDVWFGVMTAATAASLDALARFGHALSDPTRARVLMHLRATPSYPADLADDLGVTRQSMSNHLACLRGCGLVVAVPEGRRTRYELADRRLAHALADLHDVILITDPDACADADEKACC
jgi:DNA-binding transcriptional ArsR family regulator